MKSKKSLIIKFIVILLFGGAIIGLSVLFDTDLTDAFCFFDSDGEKRKRKKDEDEDTYPSEPIDETSTDIIDDTKNAYRVDEL